MIARRSGITRGLSAEEMEERIGSQYERFLTTAVTDMEHIESQTVNGRSITKVFFHPGAKVDMAMAQMTAAAQAQRPADAARNHAALHARSTAPPASRFCSWRFPGEGLSEQQLFDYAANGIRTQLLDGCRRGDSVALRRKAAAGDDRSSADAAPGQGALAGRRRQRRQRSRT